MVDWPRPSSPGSGSHAGSLAPTQIGGAYDWMIVQNQGFGTGQQWPAANLVVFTPVYVQRPATACQIGWENGAAAAGNLNVGIYDEAGARLVQATSIAMVGTSTVQFGDIADTPLEPGTYYLALQSDTAGATQTFTGSSIGVRFWRLGGLRQQAPGSFSLPATATFATYNQSFGTLVCAMLKGVA